MAAMAVAAGAQVWADLRQSQTPRRSFKYTKEESKKQKKCQRNRKETHTQKKEQHKEMFAKNKVSHQPDFILANQL